RPAHRPAAAFALAGRARAPALPRRRLRGVDGARGRRGRRARDRGRAVAGGGPAAAGGAGPALHRARGAAGMSGVRVAEVMGVSGSGKTTMARALAQTWPATFLDADDFHSQEARAHMAAGRPLTDAMRAPWVERIAAELRRRVEAGERVALTFSGLRR